MDLYNDDTWDHSGELLTYSSAWKPGQPSNPSGVDTDDCGALSPLGWYDAKCVIARLFLCEVEY